MSVPSLRTKPLSVVFGKMVGSALMSATTASNSAASAKKPMDLGSARLAIVIS